MKSSLVTKIQPTIPGKVHLVLLGKQASMTSAYFPDKHVTQKAYPSEMCTL